MSKNSYVAVPNTIITDPGLYPSTKRVYVAMLAYKSRKGTLNKTVSQLAMRSHCSPSAVQQAVAELTHRGLVQRSRRYRYCALLKRKIYASNTYILAKRDFSAGYTLVPRSLLTRELTHAAFLVALYLYMTAGRKGRSYPSLQHISDALYLAKSTVCVAIEAHLLLQELYRYHCRKENHAYSCNSYYPTGWLRKRSVLQKTALFLSVIIPETADFVNIGRSSDFQQTTRY